MLAGRGGVSGGVGSVGALLSHRGTTRRSQQDERHRSEDEERPDIRHSRQMMTDGGPGGNSEAPDNGEGGPANPEFRVHACMLPSTGARRNGTKVLEQGHPIDCRR